MRSKQWLQWSCSLNNLSKNFTKILFNSLHNALWLHPLALPWKVSKHIHSTTKTTCNINCHRNTLHMWTLLMRQFSTVIDFSGIQKYMFHYLDWSVTPQPGTHCIPRHYPPLPQYLFSIELLPCPTCVWHGSVCVWERATCRIVCVRQCATWRIVCVRQCATWRIVCELSSGAVKGLGGGCRSGALSSTGMGLWGWE